MIEPPLSAWIRVLRGLFVALLLVSLAGGLFTILTAIIWEGLNDVDVTMRLVMMPFVGLIYGCLGLAALYAARRGHTAAMITILLLQTAGAIGWAAVLFDVTATDRGALGLQAVAGSVSIVAVMLTLVARLLVMPQPTTFLRLAIRTQAVLMLLVGTAGVMMIWTRPWWQAYEQLVIPGIIAAVLVVIFGLGILPTLVRRGVRPAGPARESVPSRMKIELTCPKCGVEQRLGTGVTACTACRFALVIEIEEQRCHCGYLLYRLAGETCPECGRMIPAGERRGERGGSEPADGSD